MVHRPWIAPSALMLWAVSAAADGAPAPLLWGGCGGAYLAAEPGELTVEIVKRDRHRADVVTELRALLVSPDRRVVDEVRIPFDGAARGSGLGPAQTATLRATVDRPGIWAVNVTVSNDRYGDHIAWGLRTNARRYLIETSRGHRDERHQEPIVLLSPDQPAEIAFQPRRGAFDLAIENLPETVGGVTVHDAGGTLLQAVPAAAGRAAASFAADEARTGPWRLRLPAAQATIHLDGVTRWDGREPSSDLCYWTPRPDSWFDWIDFRWLLTPYRRDVWAAPGTDGLVPLRLHNNSPRPVTVRVAAEAQGLQLALPWDTVPLAPGESRELGVTYRMPAVETRAIVRATTDTGLETWSSLTFHPGEAPAHQPLALPFLLRPYEHENEQLGHLPGFPMDNQLYFAPDGRPHCLTSRGLGRLVDGRWEYLALPPGTGAACGKVAFDADGAAYVLVSAGRQASLLRLARGAGAFEAAPLPMRTDAGSSYDLAEFTGGNPEAGPPAVLRYTQTAADPRLIWRRLCDLELFLPATGPLSAGQPLLISRLCIGLAAHSGIPTTVTSRGEQVYVVWGEATDPDVRVPGVPTFVATVDRRTREVSAPVLVGHGPPANDVHNTPSMTLDPTGLLHVLVGTHGQPFPYTRTLRPDDATAWTDPAPARGDLPQTYVGLVCGPDGTLHTVFRLWRRGQAPHPLAMASTLAYMRKPPGGDWSEPRVLIVAPFSEYSVWYHRLTIDRRGRLFVSYDYWSTYWFYRLDHVGRRRTVILSPDGGDTWKLAQDADLAP